MPTVEDLGKRVKSKYPEYRDMPDIEVGRRVKARFADYSDFEDVPEKKTGAARFVETAEPLVNPANIALGAAEATANPTGFVQGTLGGSGGEYDRDTLLAKAQEFAKTGNYAKAARYAIGYAIPFLGGQITEAGDMMEAGDIAGGLGKTFGIAAATVGPKYVPKVAAKTAAKTVDVAQKAGPVANAVVQEGVRQLPGYEAVSAMVRAGKEAANKGKASSVEPVISATEKFNRLMDEAKTTAPSVGDPRIQFQPARPKRLDPRPARKQEPRRVEVEESRPAVRDNEPPYIPPTIEDKLAGLTPEIQEAIRQRRDQPGRGPVLMGGEKAEHGPLAAPLKRPPAAEVPVEQPKAAPDARATAEMLANDIDQAVDSTIRANLAKKLTPEQMAEAEELAAAMGQPPGQRPSLGKVVIEDAEVGAEIAAANGTAQAEKMAAKLNETGITADMAQRINAQQWRQVQYAAGADPRSTATHLEKPPSAARQAEVIEMLRKMEKPKVTPGDTMVDAIAMSSPSGKMSGRARAAAQKRLGKELFGEEGLQRPKAPEQTPTQKADLLLQRAKDLRTYAAKGMKPRAFVKEAERLEAEASTLRPQPDVRAEAQAIEEARKANPESLFPNAREVKGKTYTNHAGFKESFIDSDGLVLLPDVGGGNVRMRGAAIREADRLRRLGFAKPIRVRLQGGKEETI